MNFEGSVKGARVLALRAAGGGARLLVDIETCEGGETRHETLSLFSARLSRLPRVGAISEEKLAELRREAAAGEAINAGMRVLAFGRCSRKRLSEKLRMRGHAPDAVSAAVVELSARGYLQESDGALREAERALAKLWADRRILADLHAKGYPDEALDAVRERLLDEDEPARCRTLVRCRIGSPRDAAERRRAVAFLVRYGYDTALIRAVLGGDDE